MRWFHGKWTTQKEAYGKRTVPKINTMMTTVELSETNCTTASMPALAAWPPKPNWSFGLPPGEDTDEGEAAFGVRTAGDCEREADLLLALFFLGFGDGERIVCSSAF